MKNPSGPRRLLIGLAAMAAASLVQAQGQPQPQPAVDGTAAEQRQQTQLQPGNNAPVWREVHSGEANYTSIKGRETDVLIQPQARFAGQKRFNTSGEAWREFRNGTVTFYGGWLVALVLLALAGVYFAKGPIKMHDKPTGRMIERFSTPERVAHWCMGISFVVLGGSGLIMLFGKYVLLPVIGYTLFGWLTALGKNLHNFVAPFFIVSTLVFIVMYVRDNLPRMVDFDWLFKAYAVLMRGEHVPSGRFNAGEKGWFWIGVVGLSIIVSVSGVVLLFPNFDQPRATMQYAWIWHASAAIIFISMSLFHIYMGTIGMEGAYRAMREGVVDEAWGKEHHSLWYDEVMSGKRPGRSPASGGAVPAGAPHQKQE
jgi:formate dehydrogenase subunit gamma